MILDNFSFITDQVAEVEDDNWDTGATSTQVLNAFLIATPIFRRSAWWSTLTLELDLTDHQDGGRVQNVRLG